MTRNDVDDAVHGVRAPERTARAADDFEALDVFDQRVLHIPEHAGEQRRIDAAPSMSTSSLLAIVVLLKPRAVMAYRLESTRATWRFGARRSISGMLV